MEMSMNKSSVQGGIISAAVVLGVASLGSRLAGLLRERVLTTVFGAGDIFDAFVAAFRLPDLIFNLIVVGALAAAFIPLFTEKLVKGEKKGQSSDAMYFANSVMNLVFLVVAVLSGIYILLANYLVPIITPGFSGEQLQLTIMLSRIMALQPVFLSVSFIFSGVLNSYKRFVAYAFAPILYNVGIIIGVLFLVPKIGIAGLGWGVVLGAALHMLVQMPSVLAVGWHWQPVMSWTSEDIKTLRRMILPRMFGLSTQQVNLFLVTILGSTLAAGSISVFHLANNVQGVPIGLFGIAFAQAAFPTMAEQQSRKNYQGFRRTVTRTFRYILFFIIPISVFFFLLRAQLVRVLFGAGAFDWEDTVLTLETLGLLLLSLFAQASIPLLARAFYVRQNTITPVIISLISIVLNIGLAIILAPWMGVQGLALAFSVAAVAQLFMLLGTLYHVLHGFDDREVLLSLVKITFASLGAGLVVQEIKYPVSLMVDMRQLWGVATQLFLALGAGGLAYIGLSWIFRCDELTVLVRYMPRKIRGKLVLSVETSRFESMSE